MILLQLILLLPQQMEGCQDDDIMLEAMRYLPLLMHYHHYLVERGVVRLVLNAFLVRIAAATVSISFYSPTTLYIDLFSYNYEHFY